MVNGKHVIVIMVDTSTIHNKNGNDYLKCNYCVKYKCCTKMLTIVDILIFLFVYEILNLFVDTRTFCKMKKYL